MPKIKLSPVVYIDAHVHTDLAIEAQKWFPKETGGVLMGYWKSSHEVIITNIIGPGPKAVHTLYSFIPDDEYQIKFIADLYFKSKAKETYLGDWHTHPNVEAYLSPIDKKTLKKITAYKPARLDKTLMLVMSIQKVTKIRIWYHQFKGILRRSSIEEITLVKSR